MPSLHLSRVSSPPQAKPFRSRDLDHTDSISVNEAGLLEWSPDDIENPRTWSFARKCYITAVCILLVINAAMSASAPSGCIPGISKEFGLSDEVTKLTVTLFLLGFCSGPSLWAPLSEFYGRRRVYIATFMCYFAFLFLCAFTTNATGLLIGRFLGGMFIGGVLSNTPGLIADLWDSVSRGNGMALLIGALQVGSGIGPITAGFYELTLSWRWTFYQELWVAGFTLILLPTIPETLPSRALLLKARRIRKQDLPDSDSIQAPVEMESRSLSSLFKVALTRPWRILLDPIACLLAIYLAFVYTMVYILFTIFPIAFIDIRGWNAGVGELPLLSTALGAIVGGALVYHDSLRRRRNAAAGKAHVPEDAMPVAMIGAVLFPIGIFWFAWTAQYASVHWIVPTLGAVVLSIPLFTLFVAFLSYLSESYLEYAASAQAGNQIVRCLVASTAPLWSKQLFGKLGVGGGGSLIGGIAILLMPIPFVLYKYGARMRAASRFAPVSKGEEIAGQEDEKEISETSEDDAVKVPIDAELNIVEEGQVFEVSQYLEKRVDS